MSAKANFPPAVDLRRRSDIFPQLLTSGCMEKFNGRSVRVSLRARSGVPSACAPQKAGQSAAKRFIRRLKASSLGCALQLAAEFGH